MNATFSQKGDDQVGRIRSLTWKISNNLWRHQFARLSGVMLAFTGTIQIVSSFYNGPMQKLPDPFFGLAFGHLMLLYGIFQVLAAFLCLFVVEAKFGLGMMIWLGVNFSVYRAGLWSEGWYQACGFQIRLLGLSATGSDWLVSGTTLALLAGSLAWYWRRPEHREAGLVRMKMGCPACGGRMLFDVRNTGQKTACPHCKKEITLLSPEKLKMSCFFCQGHIEFPAHAIGEKMPCPHCKMDITLKKDA